METIELRLQRIFDDGETTIGGIVETSPKLTFHGFTCEDQKQTTKVAHETRIWKGRYEVKQNKCVDAQGNPSPLTQKYRALYPWFKWHLEITGIPGFVGVYIHIGNSDKDTDGCVLIGDRLVSFTAKLPTEKILQNSKDCFERFYKYITTHLEAGDKVFITIADEPWIK